MKKEYAYVGQIDNLHIFEEKPIGTIKKASHFAEYLRFFNFIKGKTFLETIMESTRFIPFYAKPNRFTMKEVK